MIVRSPRSSWNRNHEATTRPTKAFADPDELENLSAYLDHELDEAGTEQVTAASLAST